MSLDLGGEGTKAGRYDVMQVMEEGWEMKSCTDPPKEPPPRLPKSLMHIHRPEPNTASQTPPTPAARTIRRGPPPPIPPRNKIGKSELANPRNMEEMIQRVSDVRRLLEKHTGLIEVMHQTPR